VMIVSGILNRMRTAHAQYKDFAILYRTNSQSRSLEEQLRRRNIPYMIYSGNSFFDRAEVKDMMAYFKLVVNPNDDESFKRVVNKPARGIGDTSISALNETARAHACSLFKAAYMPDTELYGLKPAALNKIKEFCNMIDALAPKVHMTDAHALALEISDKSGLFAFYKADTSIEGISRASNVEELLNSVASFIEDREEEVDPEFSHEAMVFTLDDYLENVSLLSNADIDEDEDGNNKIALMTVHSAKGLEFPYVFIAGLEENLFPNCGMLASRQDVEEERRLFYVAVTRAQRAVCLSFATTRMRNGKHESNPPSRFIKEIDKRYIENPLDEEDYEAMNTSGQFWQRKQSAGGYGQSGSVHYEKRNAGPVAVSKPAPVIPSRATPDVIDPNFVAVPMTELYVGERIEHNRFGAGLIKEITGTVPELKAKIDFDDYGEKLLLLKYAKLRPLSSN